jgi:hypothetical protein
MLPDSVRDAVRKKLARLRDEEKNFEAEVEGLERRLAEHRVGLEDTRAEIREIAQFLEEAEAGAGVRTSEVQL